MALHEVDPGLFVGDETDCIPASAGPALRRPGEPWSGIIHAAKFPCHATLLGYSGKVKLAPTHPEYLAAERPGHLVLNMIDPPVPLFRLESFTRALDYIDRARVVGPVLLHCNAGLSRAPSLALVYLAKRRTVLPGGSFAEAREAFQARYPRYEPGAGLVTFLTEHWSRIQ